MIKKSDENPYDKRRARAAVCTSWNVTTKVLATYYSTVWVWGIKSMA